MDSNSVKNDSDVKENSISFNSKRYEILNPADFRVQDHLEAFEEAKHDGDPDIALARQAYHLGMALFKDAQITDRTADQAVSGSVDVSNFREAAALLRMATDVAGYRNSDPEAERELAAQRLGLVDTPNGTAAAMLQLTLNVVNRFDENERAEAEFADHGIRIDLTGPQDSPVLVNRPAPAP